MARVAAVTRAVPAAGRTARKTPLATGVPASSTKAPRQARPKSLLHWDVDINPTVPEDQVRIDPRARALSMTIQTWNWLKNSTSGQGDLLHEKSEAVRLMKVTMWQGGRHHPQAPEDRTPKRAPGADGIRQLCVDLQMLTGRLAALDATDDEAVAAAAKEYAKHRDRMAILRAAFTEAEGSFELAQELLVSKMGVE